MKEAVTTCHTDDDDIIGVTLSLQKIIEISDDNMTNRFQLGEICIH